MKNTPLLLRGGIRINRKLRQKLRKIFVKHDPIKIYSGTNVDEYDPEIDMIVPFFHPKKDFQDFLTEMHAIFITMFDARIAGPKSRYKSLAKEVYECLSKELYVP